MKIMKNKGVTLIELTISIVVGSILIVPVGLIMVAMTKAMRDTEAQLMLQQDAALAIDVLSEYIPKADAYRIYTSDSGLYTDNSDISPLPSWAGTADPIICLRIPRPPEYKTEFDFVWIYEAPIQGKDIGLWIQKKEQDNTRPIHIKSRLILRNVIDKDKKKGLVFTNVFTQNGSLRRSVCNIGIQVDVQFDVSKYTINSWGLARNIKTNQSFTIIE